VVPADLRRLLGKAGRPITQGCMPRMLSGLLQRWPSAGAYVAIVALALSLGGCLSETFQRGYVLPEGALEQIRLGASQEQVLIVLGTPSTVATVSGEAFYYISQRAERAVSFMPTKITDQRVVAIYFDKDRRVERVASYGIKDGRVFDFISRTTPTAGSDISVVKAMLDAVSNAHLGLPL
jgi:outer membrane protein assembly factor BamE (lipoprotein component of BamABCDE complex)